MTKAKFTYLNHKFQKFEISGHAEYADEGLDIVCAGISATVINSLNLVLKLIGKKAKFNEDQEEGYMKLEIVDLNIDKSKREFLELTIDNMIESLMQISDMYPNHLKVKIEK